MKKLLTIIGLSSVITFQAQAGGYDTYRITITNATTHQVLTPPSLLSITKSLKFLM